MFDCVVIGLGGVGSFALRAVVRDMHTSAASRSVKILGLERYEVGHSKGSSHGKSRVYRKAYFEHPSYVPWCQYSEKEFRSLEKSANVSLLEECGVLVVAPEQQRSWLNSCVEAANQHNIPIEELTTTELQSRFPQYRYVGGKDMVGVFEKGGGMVRPERAVEAAMKEAQEVDGIDVLVWNHCQVLSVEEKKMKQGKMENSDGDIGGDPTPDDTYVEIVVVRKNKDEEHAAASQPNLDELHDIKVTIEARKVVVAAGAWTSDILPSWKTHLKPIRILQSWVDISNATGNTSTNSNGKEEPLLLYSVLKMPCAVMVNPDELPIPVYCLPADPGADEADDANSNPDKYKTCIKLGIHGDVSGYGRIDPNNNHQMTVTAEEQNHMDSAIRSALNPDVSSQLPCIETRPCMYTMTDDENFMIGVPDGYSKICAVAGLSGHGFKMAPALGQMLADFATDKGLDHWNAEFCSPKRFGV